MPRLTPEIQKTIVAFARAGGFPEVAAEAAGVSRRVFVRWLRRGEQPGARRRFRAFTAAVREAVAQARLKAEVAVHEGKPLDWLKHGPGRGDWGAKGRPPAAERVMEDPETRGRIAKAMELAGPYPDFRVAFAELIGG